MPGTTPRSIDLNADLGEGYGRYTLEGDVDVIPHITSANIACGFHAGDPRTLDAAVAMAAEHRVGVGAHPGFPDRVGFGRRMMALGPEEIITDVVYQIGAVQAFCHRHGTRLRHVKPHGALGNLAWKDDRAAEAVAAAVESVDPRLIVMAWHGSALERQARRRGLTVAREAFLDRAYAPDGTLVPRSRPGAVLRGEEAILRRVRRLARDGTVQAIDGTVLDVDPDSLCLHGDTAGAVDLLAKVGAALQAEGVTLRTFHETGEHP
ncbi:5-oxoprolinase subunit PxpA [Actinomadura sp. KC216]|uniref:LamB/YcsF family protein n=1 Tax=Actinomadura sp. KC216 TaxID=2530370 RepID=UPI0010467535|nr:5-oxoprolinase subunit PxpA [Actinomadura sp. KC216]TDB91098.1 5-oxoprolinase subunit PxpA [Actinomadura sp. KC216]